MPNENIELNVIGKINLSQLTRGLNEAQRELDNFKRSAGGVLEGGKLTLEIQQKAAGATGGMMEMITGPLGIIAGAITALLASSAALRSTLGGFVRLFLQLIKPIADVVSMLLKPFLILLRPIVRALNRQMREVMRTQVRPLQKEAMELFRAGDTAGGTAKLMEAAGVTIVNFFGIIGGAILGAINPFKGSTEEASTKISEATDKTSKAMDEAGTAAKEKGKKEMEAGNVVKGAADILKGNLLTTGSKAVNLSGSFATLMNPFATYTEKYNAMNSIISTISGIEMPKLKTEINNLSGALPNATKKLEEMAGVTLTKEGNLICPLPTTTSISNPSSFLENLPVVGPLIKTLRNFGIFQNGGTIPHTGFHYLHKGETVVPAGQSASTLNVNITGANFQLQRMIERTVEQYMRTQYTNY